MADSSETGYLSIGEVLGLLLEEFPDVTISKIRFLESQGLISPERTPSGYRKFYDPDVDLLRVILTEQRRNYLPLRVIKDRLANGEIDPTGEHLRPDGDELDEAGELGPSDEPDSSHDALADRQVDDVADDSDPTPAEVPTASIASHPASRGTAPSAPATPEAAPVPAAPDDPEPESDPIGAAPQLLPGVLLDRDEFCAMVGITSSELSQLEDFGIVQPRTGGAADVYDEDAVTIAKPAAAFLRAGIDARHLRNWRTSAEREASLYEQIITPRFRQRNPEARAEALRQLRHLDGLGATLRTALTRQALRHHFDG